jgi:hypothetical protein
MTNKLENTMANEIKVKKHFGAANIDHISPTPTRENYPRAFKVCVSFENAMRLHLSLGQALAKLNTYNRAKDAGKRSAVGLVVYLDKQTMRLRVIEDKLQSKEK